jgi:hypothetical protein
MSSGVTNTLRSVLPPARRPTTLENREVTDYIEFVLELAIDIMPGVYPKYAGDWLNERFPTRFSGPDALDLDPARGDPHDSGHGKCAPSDANYRPRRSLSSGLLDAI